MWKVISLLLVLGGLASCDMPRDAKGTLERVRGGTMRVGLVEQAPFASFEDAQPSGIEVELVQQLAEQLDAEVVWIPGGEQRLFEQLEGFELDLVIGGITRSTPWSSRLGLSLHHLSTQRDGNEHLHVFAVPPGENGWLRVVDDFLFHHRDQSQGRFAREQMP